MSLILTATGKVAARLNIASGRMVLSPAFSPDGTTLVAQANGDAVMIDLLALGPAPTGGIEAILSGLTAEGLTWGQRLEILAHLRQTANTSDADVRNSIRMLEQRPSFGIASLFKKSEAFRKQLGFVEEMPY